MTSPRRESPCPQLLRAAKSALGVLVLGYVGLWPALTRASAEDRIFFADNGEAYSGGRGLVTFEGPPGMFINPTSGTLARGQLTVQFCAAILPREDDRLTAWYAPIAAYGLTDWLEIGGVGVVFDQGFETDAAGGPYLRTRILKDEQWWPELSLGGILREGDDILIKRTIFTAASKGFSIDPDGLLRAVRVHAGFRQFWQDSDVNPANGSIVYGGLELAIPRHVYLIGEISNEDDLPHLPFAFGLQLRHPDGFGFTLAGMQTGNEDAVGVYVGIGVNFF